MSASRTIVYGAGGHGKVVADMLLANCQSGFWGFVDDRADSAGTRVLGFPVLGNAEWLSHVASMERICVALGVGENRVRRKLAERCVAQGCEILTLVHPRAVISPSAALGAGSVVMAGAVVNPCARVGKGGIVNTGAVVEHDVVVEDYVHLSPNASLGGNARVGEGSHIGLGATVLPGVTVGSFVTVGAGAVVTRNTPDKVVLVGIPARVLRPAI